MDLPQCGRLGNNQPSPRDGAASGQEPQQPGALHDSRVPPDQHHSRLIQYQPGTPRDGKGFAASHRGVRSRW